MDGQSVRILVVLGFALAVVLLGSAVAVSPSADTEQTVRAPHVADSSTVQSAQSTPPAAGAEQRPPAQMPGATTNQPLPSAVSRPAKLVSVDLKMPLPKKLDLMVGQKVVFENGTATIAARETDCGKGSIFAKATASTGQVAAFSVRRVGAGEFTISLTVQKQGRPQVETLLLPVTVTPMTTVIDLARSPLPTKLDLIVGENVVFTTAGPGARIVEALYTEVSDGKATPLLKVRPKSTVVAQRIGHGNIVLSYKYHPRGQVFSQTIQATVAEID